MNILLITYYFPPCGGAAVQRWLRMIPLLIENGINVSVITTKNGDYPITDESLLLKIPKSVKVFRTYTPSINLIWQKVFGVKQSMPYGSLVSEKKDPFLKKLLLWTRVNIILPDARIPWNPFAQRYARKILMQDKFDWIVTTGPPHSTHLIGLKLKKKYKIKWLADFRDPWRDIFYLQNKKQNSLSRKINTTLESAVVKNADLTLTASAGIAENLIGGNKHVFYNGFNSIQFDSDKYKKTDKFRIKFIGQLTEGQYIEPLFQLLSDKLYQYELKDIEFYLIGTKLILDIKYSFPIVVTDPVSHDTAISEMINSELLVLVINKTAQNQGILTTKLFEYIGSGTPVVCIGPPDGEAASVIRESQCGVVYQEMDNNIWSFILEIYKNWQADISLKNTTDVSQWSVQKQIVKLIELLQAK